jgi:hypothetical protein
LRSSGRVAGHVFCVTETRALLECETKLARMWIGAGLRTKARHGLLPQTGCRQPWLDTQRWSGCGDPDPPPLPDLGSIFEDLAVASLRR